MEKNARATKKQQELLQFVDDFIKAHGYGPSYREIMRSLGYKSVSTVAIHIDQLIVKGYLEKTDNSARSLSVVTLRSENSRTPSTGTLSLEDQLMKKIEVLKSKEAFDDAEVLQKALEIIRLEQ
jgi:SOS-response transcriptional repressor LexA